MYTYIHVCVCVCVCLCVYVIYVTFHSTLKFVTRYFKTFDGLV